MVDFGGKRLRVWSRGFVCQTKKVNPCGYIPVRDLTMVYSVNSKGRGSILDSIIAECYRKLSVVALWASTKWLTPKCKQQAEPAKSARRKECDHMRSPFRFDKQSHVTEIVDVWRYSQLSRLSLNSRSTCFGSIEGR